MTKLIITEEMIKGKYNKYDSKGQIEKDAMPFPLFDCDFAQYLCLNRNLKEDAMLIQNNFNIIASERLIQMNSEITMELLEGGFIEELDELDGFIQRIISVGLDICRHMQRDFDVRIPIAFILSGKKYNAKIHLMVEQYCAEMFYINQLFDIIICEICQGRRLKDIEVTEFI